MTSTEVGVENQAQRIADRGRDALVERLRSAYGDAAAAHSDLISLDDDHIEALVQSAADRADGMQWRRALADAGADELGVSHFEALTHPAVARAQGLVGAPSYEQSLAELVARPVPPMRSLPRVRPAAPAPAPAPYEEPAPAEDTAAYEEPASAEDAAAYEEPAPAEDAAAAADAWATEAAGRVEAAIQADAPVQDDAPEQSAAPAMADIGDEEALAGSEDPTAAVAEPESPEPDSPELQPLATEPMPQAVSPAPGRSEHQAPLDIVKNWPTQAFSRYSSPPAEHLETVEADDQELELLPEPDPVELNTEVYDVEASLAEEDAQAALETEQYAAPVEAEVADEEPAAEQAPPSAQRSELEVVVPAIHLGGVANLPTKREGLSVRLSADGLDILQHEGDILGRLIWDEIEALEVPNLRVRRRHRPGRARLVVRTPYGDASFDVPDMSGDELRDRVEPVMRLYGRS